MTSTGEGNDATDAEDADRRPARQTHQAVLGAMMCVVALVVVGVILDHAAAPSSRATDVIPTSNSQAVTTQTLERAATVVKKRAPRPKVAATTAPTTVRVTTPPTRPPVV
ncbi:MAG: hypothetical protein QOG65_2847, partial [Actinomycetota bacterium]|nr:hypothetical protein [Actinomycetota bacterium]